MRRTSQMLTLTMLIGVMFVAMSQLIQSFAQTDATCTIVLYLFYFGSVLVLAGSLAKNYRIYRIFSNRTATAVNITESMLLVIVAIITIVFLVGMTAMVAVFGYNAIVLQSSTNIYYKYVQCLIPNDTWNTIFQFYIRLYCLFLLIASLIFAWLTRKVRSDYRESKTLTAFIYIVAAAFITLIPLQLTFGDETDSELFRYIIQMEYCTIVILSALGLLFFPKLYTIFRENKRGTSRITLS
jgi:hypothetical protein